MRKIVAILFILKGISSYSQNVSFESLKLKSSPAFVILGVDPQNIERPNTPTDFIAGIQSATVNNKLQPNFALETTPFFWKKPDKSKSKQVKVINYFTKKNDLFSTIGRTFTFSFASSEADTTIFKGLSSGTGLGTGLRFSLIEGTTSKKTLVELASLHSLGIMGNILQSIIGQLVVGNSVDVDLAIRNWSASHASAKLSATESKEILDLVSEIIKGSTGKIVIQPTDQTSIEALRTQFLEIEAKESTALATLNKVVMPLTKEGFMLDFAYAHGFLANKNEWNNLNSAKAAFWLTPSFRFNTRKDPTVVDYLDLMAVFRVTLNKNEIDPSDYYDAGIKLQYTHNRFSLSTEYIYRWLSVKPENVNSNNTNRFDLSMDYKVNDFITFKTTFGRNFDGNSVRYSDPGKMFAVGGFNFGFSNFFQ